MTDTQMQLIQVIVYSLSSLAAVIAIYSFVSRKRKDHKKKKIYTPKQKIRYWKKVNRRTKDPETKKYSGSRLRTLEKQVRSR